MNLPMSTHKHVYTIPALFVTLILCGISGAHAATLEGNLRAWYLMGENAGLAGNTIQSVPDQSGNGVTANANGAPQLVGGVPFNPFPLGPSQAADFGGNSYLLAPSDASFNQFGDQSFSVSLWAKSFNNPPQFQKLFQQNPGGGNPFHQAEIGFNNTGGRIIWNIRDGGGANSELETSPIFDDSDWHHLVFLRDAVNQELRVYIDGQHDLGAVSCCGNEGGVGSLSNAGPLAIGAETNGSNAFPGSIDDFRLYDVALNNAQVAEIFNNGQGDFLIPEPGSLLMCCWGLALLSLCGWRRRKG